MNKIDLVSVALYINNLCTDNEAKVLYAILFCDTNTKENTDYIVKMSGFSKNHFYTIRKRLYDKGVLGVDKTNYFVDIYALEYLYKEEHLC